MPKLSRVLNDNNNTSAFFWGDSCFNLARLAAGAEACTRLSATRNFAPPARGSLDPSLSPSWSSNAPPELALRDAAASLLRVLARGVPASAPAGHGQLRPALELHHGARSPGCLSIYPPAHPSSTTSLAARGEGQVCSERRATAVHREERERVQKSNMKQDGPW